ncbi:MAG: hypothetical protein QGG36_10320 [Pirellulaceae bacterium]|jgi:hypothetical protein|nr:hypothetical protein [Pirellulaceae bacterium]
MPKYYVQSGPVRLILEAIDPEEAAVKAFQWSCDRQATIDVEDPLEHIRIAEERGWQLHDELAISERGFGRPDAFLFDTLLVVAFWQEHWERKALPDDAVTRVDSDSDQCANEAADVAP